MNNFLCEKKHLKVEDPTKEKVLMEKLSNKEINWYFYFKYKHHLHLITVYQEILPHNNQYYFSKSTEVFHLKAYNSHKCPVIIKNLSYEKYKKYMDDFNNC